MVSIEEQWPWLFDLYYHLAIIMGVVALFFFLGSIIRYRYRVLQILEERANKIYILLIAVYVVLGVYYVFIGHLNYDEGSELYASNLVYQGKIPYIDFWYTHGPLLAYIYGIPQLVFGSSLYVGRLTSLFFGVLTLVFTAKIAEKFGGKIGAIVALALMAFNLYSIYLLTYAKSYELNAFLITLSLYFLFSNRFGTPTKYILSVFFMALSAGVRQSLLIIVILLILYIIYVERKNVRTIILSSATALSTCAAIFVPFLILNRDVTIFNLYSINFQNPYSTHYNKVYVFFQIIDNYLIVSVLMSVGALILLFNRKNYPDHIKFLYVTASIVFAIHFLPTEVLPEYPVVIMPIGTILAGYAFSEIYRNSNSDFTRYYLLLAITVMILFVFLAHGPQWVDISGNKKPIQEVEEMAAYIRNNTRSDSKIIAFSTYMAVQADREMLPGFSYAYYTFRSDWSDEKAKQYNAINNNLLNQYIASRSASAILLTDFERGLIGNESVRLIEEHYDLIKTMGAWGQHVNTAYLYLPKKVVISVEKSHIGYGDTQSWGAKLPPNGVYALTLRSSSIPTIIAVGSGNADSNGNAEGSFLIGNNLPSGTTTLRVELTSDPSTFEETTFIVGDPPGSITLTVEESNIRYDNRLSWAASGFAPHGSYVVTIRSPAANVVLVIVSGNADANGEAIGSFLVGRNLPLGDNILRIEAASSPSYYSEATFRIS